MRAAAHACLYFFIASWRGSLDARVHAGRESSVPFRARNLVVSGMAVACVTLAGISVAAADDPPQPPADSAPPAAVEDYGYPGADHVFAEKGIRLKRGDGHILLAD